MRGPPPDPISPEQAEDERAQMARLRPKGRVTGERPAGGVGLGGLGMRGASPARQPMREKNNKRAKKTK